MLRHPFDLLMELDPGDIRLDCAALHLARDAHPDLPLEPTLQTLDSLAEQVADKRPGLTAPLRYQALHGVLVDDFELSGNESDYYNPENSYLNCVLERRTGIPVTLAIVWIEVARRLKWPVTGVSFPGHFLVRIDDPERFLVIDPFNAGRSMSAEDCRALFKHHGGAADDFTPRLLEPANNKTILSRVLSNLRNIYAAGGDETRLESVLRRLMAVEPENARHVQDLAAVRCRQGHYRVARDELKAYLEQRPQAASAETLQSDLRLIESAMAALN